MKNPDKPYMPGKGVVYLTGTGSKEHDFIKPAYCGTPGDMPGKEMRSFEIVFTDPWAAIREDIKNLAFQIKEHVHKIAYQPERPLKRKIPMMPLVVDNRNDVYMYIIGEDRKVYYDFIYSLITEKNEKRD